MTKSPPTNILVIVPDIIPSVVIGLLKPLIALEQQRKVNLRLHIQARLSLPTAGLIKRDSTWCDVAVFGRNTEMADLRLLYQLKRLKKRIIYEIDDNFEQISLNTPIGIYHRNYFRLHVVRRFFQLADIVRVYSPIMQERVVHYGGSARIEKSYFDHALISDIRKPPANDKIIRLAYPTGRIDDPFLENLLFSIIRVILNKYTGRVEIHLWRKEIPEQLKGIQGIILNKGVPNYEKFIQDFYRGNYHIGLAPGIDEPFFHSKTNNKYREFGGCSIAGVYSNIPPYQGSVVNGVTGLLVENSIESWVSAIESLIENPQLRQQIAIAAHADVLANYSFENAINSFLNCIETTLSRAPKEVDWEKEDDYLPLISIVDNNDLDDETYRKRINWAILAITDIGGGYSCYKNITTLLKTRPQDRYNTSLLLIDNNKHLIDIELLISFCNSAIVDLSQYNDNFEDAKRKLLTFAEQIEISYVLNETQSDISAWAKSHNATFTCVNRNATDTANEFSLCGYLAAYLDLFDKNSKFSKHKHISRLSRIVPSLFFRAKAKYYTWSLRLRKAWLLLQWRSGRRPL